MPDENADFTDEHGGFAAAQTDSLIRVLHTTIQYAVRALVLVILWGTGDVVWILYQKLTGPPVMLLNIGDILQTFGAFLAVLIAIEIFINITVYLREDVIHVRQVIATALMAVARKVIVFDFKEIGYEYVGATAAVVLSLGITYGLIATKI